MIDLPLGRRRFAAALVAVLAGLAGCTDDETDEPDGDPAEDGESPDVAIDLSNIGLNDDSNGTDSEGNASGGAGGD